MFYSIFYILYMMIATIHLVLNKLVTTVCGMFHSCTDDHNKRLIMESLGNADGVVRALGMGVEFGLRYSLWCSEIP